MPTQSSTTTVKPSPLLSVRSQNRPASPPLVYSRRKIQRSQARLENVCLLFPVGQFLSEAAKGLHQSQLLKPFSGSPASMSTQPLAPAPSFPSKSPTSAL